MGVRVLRASAFLIDERTYSYDPAGSITSRTGALGDQHYTYDTLDRLTGQEIQADGKNWQYAYGQNHNRQTRTDGAGLNELYSYQPETNPLTEVDKLLTPRLGTNNDSQRIMWNWKGEAFGEGEAIGPIEVNLRFPGQFSDKETGHHYKYLRDYAPGLGRYVQGDPIGLTGPIRFSIRLRLLYV